LVPTLAAAEGQTRLSGRFDLLPSGEIRIAAQGNSLENDTETALGLGASLEFAVAPNISIGFAPRMLFNIKGDGGSDSAKQLDLAARGKAHFPVSPRAELFGFISPGYSMLFLPDDGEDLSPKGLIIGIGGGADIMIGPTSFITLELGHTWGFQGGTEQGIKYTLATNFLHLGFGFGSKF
jgi:hypothetical protein